MAIAVRTRPNGAAGADVIPTGYTCGADFLGHQSQVVEVGQVEHLEVRALAAEGGVPAELVDDLLRGAGEGVRAQVGDVAADRLGAPGQLGLVGADADGERVGPDQVVGVAAGVLAGRADPAELEPGVVLGDGTAG